MTASENDIRPPTAAAPDSRPASDRTAGRAPKRRGQAFPWVTTGLVFALIVILVLAAALWRQQRLVEAIGRESATRYAAIDATARDAQARARQSLSTSQGNADKLAVLESKILESQSQQAALEQLYQELSRGEDEWTLIEVEQALSIASQQLQLAGNVPNSIAALQVADARLARADRPQFTPVRRAIAQDLERLRALPSVDVSGLVVKIDQLVTLFDKLPLLASVEPARRRGASQPLVETTPAVAPVDDGRWWNDWLAWWPSLRDGFLNDMRDLIRIQRVDRPDALLVSPEQGALLRENLKLRLLNARQALLSRQEHAWDADLAAISAAIPVYFDVEAPATRSAQALLTQIKDTEISIQLPGINDSLAAVRSVLPRSAVPAARQR
jgi:uroporphyrin-3 C-methyltransferase/uroporphyrinogen III methyltransferase/synthase